jgi:hypothetical protein
VEKKFDQDWSMAREGVEQLKEYLLSTQLYWPVKASIAGAKVAPVSSLTPGNLLLSLQRLQALPLDENSTAELAVIKATFEQVHKQWSASWARKAEQEFAARLKTWQDYLQELSEPARKQARDYHNQARVRCILELLLTQTGHGEANRKEALAGMDVRLRQVSAPGEFIWELEVEGAFSPGPFWFLYITIK